VDSLNRRVQLYHYHGIAKAPAPLSAPAQPAVQVPNYGAVDANGGSQ